MSEFLQVQTVSKQNLLHTMNSRFENSIFIKQQEGIDQGLFWLHKIPLIIIRENF